MTFTSVELIRTVGPGDARDATAFLCKNCKKDQLHPQQRLFVKLIKFWQIWLDLGEIGQN